MTPADHLKTTPATEADIMTKTTIVITVLAGVLLVSGCASRCDEFCRLTYGLRQVLK